MCLAGIDNFLFKLGYMEKYACKTFHHVHDPQNVNSAISSLWSYKIGQTSPVQTVMKHHSETFMKLYYLLWTFLLSFVGHVISYIFFNCQLNCSYIKGDILIIWFILGWGRRNNLMNHSFIELKRNLSTLNFSLFIYWTWLNSQYFWKWTNANPMKISAGPPLLPSCKLG